MNNQSGVLLLNKRSGVTSARAIAEIKRKLQLKKIGHAGTLDPMATGLLVCMVGNATKQASHFQKGVKAYSGTITLGVKTSTDDKEGVVLETSDAIPSEEAVLTAAKQFIGSIEQVPPQVSAIHINGNRAYDLARKGVSFSIPARTVEIFQCTMTYVGDRLYRFYIECSSGTYIRSIARDLGDTLGCGACLETLCREKSLPFTLEHAKTIEDISENDIISTDCLHSKELSCLHLS